MTLLCHQRVQNHVHGVSCRYTKRRRVRRVHMRVQDVRRRTTPATASAVSGDTRRPAVTQHPTHRAMKCLSHKRHAEPRVRRVSSDGAAITVCARRVLHDHASGDDATGAIVQCHHVWCEPARAEPRVHGVSCRYDVFCDALAPTRSAIQPFVVQTRTFHQVCVACTINDAGDDASSSTLFVTSCSAALTSTCKVINALRVLLVRR